MAWVSFVRNILTLLIMYFHIISAHDENENIVNINDLVGQNEVTCGTTANPCKSLDYAWSVILPTLKNSTLVKFSFSPGVYESKERHSKTLFYDCDDGAITQIAFEGKNYTRNSSDVQMGYAFQLSSCEIHFTGLNFQQSSNLTTTGGSLIINRCVFANTKFKLQFMRSNVTFDDVIFSNISSRESNVLVWRSAEARFINCQFQNIKIDSSANEPMFDFDSIENLEIQNCFFTNNIGSHKEHVSRKLLSIKNSEKVWIENVTFRNNTNMNITIQGGIGQHQVQIKTMIITKSYNAMLLFDDVSINATNIWIEHSRDRDDEPFLSFQKSNVYLKNLLLQCVYTKKDLEQSPLFLDSASSMNCTNCTALHCRNLCGEGYQTVQGVFCEQCPNGSSAHDWEKKCFECHPGYYAPNPGLADCIPCEAGTFCKQKGCTTCQTCTNDLFTSRKASPSCSQMSTFFIVMLGVTLLLIMSPIAIKMICYKKKKNEEENETDEHANNAYKKFENEKKVDLAKKGINNNDTAPKNEI
ncbi:uncharacterized protein [Clytia hemisphaerica]|uniref:Uncharacterized protein n=1 Tax=Clytia hemisphaerica TaxID=252671 RepID=A0A7M5WZ63_9CNID